MSTPLPRSARPAWIAVLRLCCLLAFAGWLAIARLDASSLPFAQLAEAACVLFPLAIAYAIFKRGLFGLELAVRKTLVYAGASSVVTGLYLWGAREAARLVPGETRAEWLLALVVAIACAPLHERLRRLLAWVFLQGRYDHQRLGARLEALLEADADREHVLPASLAVIEEALHPRFAALLFCEGDGRLRHQAGTWPEELALPDRLLDGEAPFSLVPLAIAGVHGLVLALDGRRLGLLLLGPLRSERPYTAVDALFLSSWARQVAFWLRRTELVAQLASRNAALEEANRELRERDRLKQDFLHATTHELRTPLITIRGFAELLDDAPPDRRASFLDQIRRSAGRLERLVDDLLDFAAIQAGRFRLVYAPHDLGGLAAQVIEGLRPQASERQVRLEVVRPATALVGRFDRDRIAQVLINLVTNALKFTPPGGAITVRVRREAEALRVEVIDSGIGIAAEHLPRLFEKFYQVESGLARNDGGAGLGLSIASSIVKGHGGLIGVESAPGQGSLFWFTLPIEPPVDAAIAEVPPPSPSLKIHSGTPS